MPRGYNSGYNAKNILAYIFDWRSGSSNIYIYIYFLHIHTALLITLNIYITKEKHSFPSIIPFSGGSLVSYALALTLIKILMKCWDGLLGPNSLLDFPDISQFLASLVFQYYRFVHLVRTTALSHTLI